MSGVGAVRLLEWFASSRWQVPRAKRRAAPIVAHYWDGEASGPVPVKDISVSGAYLKFPERWYVGTILRITFEWDTVQSGVPNSIVLPCRVVRHGTDGMGVAFLVEEARLKKELERFVNRDARPKRFLRGRGREGQALVEVALMVPLLFLLIFNAVNFGIFLFGWITISNATRAGAQYAAMGAAYASYPATATFSNIQTIVQKEAATLPGASPTVVVCETQNGTATSYPITSPTVACSVTAPPTDPETITGLAGASPYTTIVVDVTYNYSSWIGAGGIGIFNIVTPSGSIHRRTVMRVLN